MYILKILRCFSLSNYYPYTTPYNNKEVLSNSISEATKDDILLY
jgi:hypothetical protein